jgi:hypothetical protein
MSAPAGWSTSLLVMPLGTPLGAATAVAMVIVYRESFVNGQVECEEEKEIEAGRNLIAQVCGQTVLAGLLRLQVRQGSGAKAAATLDTPLHHEHARSTSPQFCSAKAKGKFSEVLQEYVRGGNTCVNRVAFGVENPLAEPLVDTVLSFTQIHLTVPISFFQR